MNYRSLDPRDTLAVLVKWRKVLMFNVGSIVLLSVVVSLVLPKSYTATTLIMPPTEQTVSLGLASVMGTGITGGLPSVARMAGLPGFGTSSDLFAALLQTRSLMEKVIHRCNLQDYYGLLRMDETILALSGQTNISVSYEGMVSLSATAGDPHLAAKIANTYVDELDKLNKKATMTRGKAARVFIQARLIKAAEELESAEESLRVYQERQKTVSLEDEVAEAIRAVATLRAEVVSREVMLGILEQFATAENPQVRGIEAEKRELEERIAKLEYGSPRGKGQTPTREGFGAGFGVPFSKVPEVGMELARRTRDVEIFTAVYALLTQQYEEARILEARDTPTVQVVDVAVPPERRSSPVRKRIVAIGLLLGLFGGIGLVFALEYLETRIRDPKEREWWALLREQLWSDLAPLRMNIVRSKRR